MENESILFRNRNYLFYIFALFITFFGNGLYFIAIVWLLYTDTNSVTSIGIFFIANLIPGLIFSPIGGVVADKFNRKTVMIFTDILRALLILIIPILYGTDFLKSIAIFIITFLIGSTDKFFFPASSGLLRQIVSNEVLFRANSYKNSAIQLGLILGSALGGIALSLYGVNTIIFINILTFLISAISIYFIQTNPSQTSVDKTNNSSLESKKQKNLSFFMDGLRFIKHKRTILLYITISSFFETIIRSLNILLLPFVLDVLFLSSKEFGIIDAFFAFGAIAGGLCSGVILKFLKAGKFLAIHIALISMNLIIFATSSSLIFPIINYFFIGFSIIQASSFITSEIQKATPIDLQGRISSTIHFIMSFVAILASIGIGFTGDYLSLRSIFLVLGSLGFLSFLWILILLKLNKISTSNNEEVKKVG